MFKDDKINGSNKIRKCIVATFEVPECVVFTPDMDRMGIW